MSGVAVRSRIVRVGNSRGIRIPMALMASARVGDEVELSAIDDGLRIRILEHPRSGWAEAAAQMHAAGDDYILDGADAIVNRFDEEEWTW